jgi:hypothetical protein
VAERRTRTQRGPDISDAGGQPPSPPEPPPTADALLALIEKSYRPLSEEESAALRTSIALTHQASAALFAFRLTNADEPDIGFAAFRAD